MGRGAIYDRVRLYGRISRIPKRVSPHKLRHTFATHVMKNEGNIVLLRDLLGHRSITSTQVYLHVTAQELREAAERHPIRTLAVSIEHLLPPSKMPFQHPPVRRSTG